MPGVYPTRYPIFKVKKEEKQKAEEEGNPDSFISQICHQSVLVTPNLDSLWVSSGEKIHIYSLLGKVDLKMV